jgi:type II secretory pathway pseudopilin PulG
MNPEQAKTAPKSSRITVVEILTVISIIVIILAFLLPERRRPHTRKSTFTRANMHEIHGCMLVFLHDNGHWPEQEQWKEQVKPYLYHSSSYSDTRDYFVDGWGNSIKYSVKETPEAARRFLYSFGPNGQDQTGQGDDIVWQLDQ